MLKIKLRKTGKRHQPSYRIVVAEAKSKRNGHYLESLGHWVPSSQQLKVDKKRYAYWVTHGAQPTMVVRKLYEKAS